MIKIQILIITILYTHSKILIIPMGPKREDFQANMWVLKGVIWGVLMLGILELLIPFFRHEEIDFMKVFSVGLRYR